MRQNRVYFFRNASFEVGFLLEPEVNLLVLAHRFVPGEWVITPFQWHAYKKFARAVPPLHPSDENNREFTIALINQKGGKYFVIRKEILPLEFAEKLHQAICKQIEEGIPPDVRKYNERVENLYELLIDDRIDSMLEARALIEKV